MDNEITRRSTLFLAGGVILPGCTSADRRQTSSRTQSPTDPPAAHDVVISLEKTSLSSPPDDVIHYENLPNNIKDAVDISIEEGYFHHCDAEQVDGLRTFERMVNELPAEGQYLQRKGTYFGIHLRIRDVIVAYSISSPPDIDTNKCQK